MRKIISLLALLAFVTLACKFPISVGMCSLPGQYDWIRGGKYIGLLQDGHYFATVRFATQEEIESLEGGLNPGEYYVVIEAPGTDLTGQILQDGDVRELRRADPKTGLANGYAFTVCNGEIYYSNLNPVPVPPSSRFKSP